MVSELKAAEVRAASEAQGSDANNSGCAILRHVIELGPIVFSTQIQPATRPLTSLLELAWQSREQNTAAHGAHVGNPNYADVPS